MQESRRAKILQRQEEEEEEEEEEEDLAHFQNLQQRPAGRPGRPRPRACRSRPSDVGARVVSNFKSFNITNALEIPTRPFFVRFGHMIHQNRLKFGADFKSALYLCIFSLFPSPQAFKVKMSHFQYRKWHSHS